MSYFIEAESKIKRELEEARNGRKESVIAGPTAETLISFCKQNDEFAQAVAQGKSFAECIKYICKGISDACSDIEVYRKAAEFYFPGAVVDFQMSIRMSQYEDKTDNIISLDLIDFLN